MTRSVTTTRRVLKVTAAAAGAGLLVAACAAGKVTTVASTPDPAQLVTVPPATTVPPPTTTLPPPPTTLPPPPPSTAPPIPPLDRALKNGVKGDDVAMVQQRLLDMHFDPGKVDGIFSAYTQQAVWAFQAIVGVERDGIVTPELWQQMNQPLTVPALAPFDSSVRRAEVDLPRQIATVWQDGQVVLITKVSTGAGRAYCENGECGNGKTNPGVFKIRRRMSGWLKAPLGELYNPLYFDGGIAFHGSLSIPNVPASHGCVRLPMNVAGYFPTLLNNGDPVYVSDGKISFEPKTPPTTVPPPVAEPAPSDSELLQSTPV
ncbi:MAG: L,D-transpeptidase family protein [Acidimicrobiia bacterium]